MRIRFKPWAREELETSPFYIDNPKEYKNKWKTAFENSNELRLELGCGKGNFVSQSSIENPNINYIAVDLIDAMLGMAKRNIEVAYGIRKSTDKEEIENEIEEKKIELKKYLKTLDERESIGLIKEMITYLYQSKYNELTYFTIETIVDIFLENDKAYVEVKTNLSEEILSNENIIKISNAIKSITGKEYIVEYISKK